MDLWSEIQYKIKMLDTSVKELSNNGKKVAEADRKYYLIKTQTSLKLKEQGNPVTFIQTIIKGVAEVAQARFELNVAQSIYDANLNAINALKIEIKVYENQLEREWGQARRE